MSWPGPFQRAEVENPCNWKNKNPTNNWGWPDKLLTVSLFPLKLPPSPQTSRDKWNSRPNEACLHLPALKPVYTLYASRLWQLKRKAKTEWCTIFHKGHIPIVPWLHGRDSRMQHDDQLTRTFRNTVVNMNLLADEHCDLLCMRKHMLSTTILLGWELASSIEQQKISWESALFERFNMCYLWFFNVLPSSSKNVQTWKNTHVGHRYANDHPMISHVLLAPGASMDSPLDLAKSSHLRCPTKPQDRAPPCFPQRASSHTTWSSQDMMMKILKP